MLCPNEGGCKISNFEVMYKPTADRSHNWTPLSHSPLTDPKLIILNGKSNCRCACFDRKIHGKVIHTKLRLNHLALVPGNKYSLRITAFNEAGSTEAEYSFFTPISSHQGRFCFNSRRSFGEYQCLNMT